MLCSLPRSCVVHPVDSFDSEGGPGKRAVKRLCGMVVSLAI